MFYYGYDPTYILVIIGFLITLIAQIFVNSSYKKYKKVNVKSGLKGFEVARKMLDSNGLTNVKIEEVKGELTDHYDPSSKVVRLSTDIYHGSTIASSSVAAHECGHAIQDKEGYFFLRLRANLVPIVNISSKLGYFAILIGLIFLNCFSSYIEFLIFKKSLTGLFSYSFLIISISLFVFIKSPSA